MAIGETEQFSAWEAAVLPLNYTRGAQDPYSTTRRPRGNRLIPSRVDIDSPAPVMVRLDRTISFTIVLMQMVRSSRTMTLRVRRHVSTSTRNGITPPPERPVH